MANLGYIQLVRTCNHHCVFCSNPKTELVNALANVRAQIDDLVDRGYYGVILTGGEPTLYPELVAVVAYARSRGMQVRMITNGSRGPDEVLCSKLFQAGLTLAHVSIYSCRPQVEASLRGVEGTLDFANAAIASLHRAGIAVNINTVINRANADHLDETVRVLHQAHPYVRHYVWNNLDPSAGKAATSPRPCAARLANIELSLTRAARYLQNHDITFRVERVPLCYMTEFAWASTETRKLVKQEERVVHFLDEKGTFHQTDFRYAYAAACNSCSLRAICAGLFELGSGYNPSELCPVFVDPNEIIRRIVSDPVDAMH